jgi:penicillin amidase
VWLENILLHHPKRWLPDKYPNYDELLAAAVEAVVNNPQAPKDLASWHWGTQNAVHIQHLILGRIPILRRWSGPGVQEQSGSGYTVKAVSAHNGPSERFTANLADMDQWKAWYEGTTFPLPFSARAVQAAKAHSLQLDPAK